MVEIKGLSELLHALEDYPKIFAEEMRDASELALDDLKSPLEEYPPEREGQTYVRTFQLQERWHAAQIDFQQTPEGFTATATNDTPYGPYVQGDPNQNPHQAWMHEDRWNTTQATLDDNESLVVGRFDEALDKVAARLGGTR